MSRRQVIRSPVVGAPPPVGVTPSRHVVGVTPSLGGVGVTPSGGGRRGHLRFPRRQGHTFDFGECGISYSLPHRRGHTFASRVVLVGVTPSVVGGPRRRGHTFGRRSSGSHLCRLTRRTRRGHTFDLPTLVEVTPSSVGRCRGVTPSFFVSVFRRVVGVTPSISSLRLVGGHLSGVTPFGALVGVTPSIFSVRLVGVTCPSSGSHFGGRSSGSHL